jgi:hypothetical protein
MKVMCSSTNAASVDFIQLREEHWAIAPGVRWTRAPIRSSEPMFVPAGSSRHASLSTVESLRTEWRSAGEVSEGDGTCVVPIRAGWSRPGAFARPRSSAPMPVDWSSTQHYCDNVSFVIRRNCHLCVSPQVSIPGASVQESMKILHRLVDSVQRSLNTLRRRT